MEKSGFDVKSEIICAVGQHLNSTLDDPTVSEIGDGNINRVFRIKFADKSMVVKFAPESAVILPSIKLSRDRGEREGKYLSLARKYQKGFVPEFLFYDKSRHMLFIEDLGKVCTLSEMLIKGDFDSFDAESMAYFTADTCFFTSRYALNRAKEADDKAFDFHDLCELTKELVFEQPFYDHPNNNFTKENRSFIEEQVYCNSLLKENAELLKRDFLENHEAIIHGDLHTASIFAIDKRNVVFDGEFSYSGPIAYDTGNVIAHLMMTYFRWSVANNDKGVEADRIIFKAYDYLEFFKNRFSDLLGGFGKEEYSNDSAVVDNIIKYTYKYAASECLRRVIGLAKAPIFTKNLSESERASIERCLILAGCEMMTKDIEFDCAQELLDFCKMIYTKGRN